MDGEKGQEKVSPVDVGSGDDLTEKHQVRQITEKELFVPAGAAA